MESHEFCFNILPWVVRYSVLMVQNKTHKTFKNEERFEIMSSLLETWFTIHKKSKMVADLPMPDGLRAKTRDPPETVFS